MGFWNKYGIEIILSVIAVILLAIWGTELSSKTRVELTNIERDDLFKKRGIVPAEQNLQLVVYNNEKTDFTPVNLALLTCGIFLVIYAIVVYFTRKLDPVYQIITWILMLVLLIVVAVLSVRFGPSKPIIPYYPSANDLARLGQNTLDDKESQDFVTGQNGVMVTPNPEKRIAYYDIQTGKRYLNKP
jgi:hypothetical protein